LQIFTDEKYVFNNMNNSALLSVFNRICHKNKSTRQTAFDITNEVYCYKVCNIKNIIMVCSSGLATRLLFVKQCEFAVIVIHWYLSWVRYQYNKYQTNSTDTQS